MIIEELDVIELTDAEYEVTCPLCGAPELNEETGLLNVRGLKVADASGRWWSQCISKREHPQYVDKRGNTRALGDIWFHLDADNSRWLIEVDDGMLQLPIE